MSLRRLGVERIDLFQLHRIDRRWPLEEQIGALRDLQREGKVRHIGLSEVSIGEIERARHEAPIVGVQNRYNVLDRAAEDVLQHCERHGIAFIPWYPIATGDVTRTAGPLDAVARAIDATPVQVALAWLLQHSAVMLPIPGTAAVSHLEENVAAATVGLSPEQLRQLDAIAAPA